MTDLRGVPFRRSVVIPPTPPSLLPGFRVAVSPRPEYTRGLFKVWKYSKNGDSDTIVRAVSPALPPPNSPKEVKLCSAFIAPASRTKEPKLSDADYNAIVKREAKLFSVRMAQQRKESDARALREDLKAKRAEYREQLQQEKIDRVARHRAASVAQERVRLIAVSRSHGDIFLSGERYSRRSGSIQAVLSAISERGTKSAASVSR